MTAKSQLPSPTSLNPARRRFLVSTLLALVAGRTLTACDSSAPPGEAAGQAPAWLAKITGDPDAVTRFGKLYLEMHPDQRDIDTLLASIEQTVAGDGKSETTDDTRLLAALQQAVRDDYRRNEVIKLGDGWLLSLTEARLYGAVALLQ